MQVINLPEEDCAPQPTEQEQKAERGGPQVPDEKPAVYDGRTQESE